MQLLGEVLAFVFVFVVLEITALFAPHQLPLVGFTLAIFLFLYSKLDKLEMALSEERRAQYQRFQERRREVVGATVLLTFILCGAIYVLHVYEVIVPVPHPGEGPRMATEPWGGTRARAPVTAPASVAPAPPANGIGTENMKPNEPPVDTAPPLPIPSPPTEPPH